MAHLKAVRVEVKCEVCGRVRVYLGCFLRQHPGTRYCSYKCAGAANRKPEAYTELICDICQTRFNRRTDHLKRINYCSRQCFGLARKRETKRAKWQNPEKVRAYMREYRKKNRIKLNRQSAERQRNSSTKRLLELHRRRQKDRSAGKLRIVDWEIIKILAGQTCLCCLQPKKLEIDHIIPLSLGGEHNAKNVQPLCRSCNASKGSKSIDYRINAPMFKRFRQAAIEAEMGIQI